jgi:tetratricopeptide (TPR) repeat protein
MRTSTPTYTAVLSSLLVFSLGIILPPCVSAALPAFQSAEELTRNAARLIGEQEFEQALQVLDRAEEEDSEYWEIYYQRGRALAMSGSMQEGLEAFLLGCELNPGFAHGHQLAAVAASQVGDFDTAWDHAIRAYLAGAEMSGIFGQLGERSEVPADIDERLSAWKVYVAEITADEALARAELPDQQDQETISQRIQESAADIGKIRLHLRNAISRSPHFGLVPEPGLAQYVLAVSVDDLSARQPRSMDGYLRLYDISNGEVVYYRQVSLRNISAGGSLYGELERYIGQLEEWKQEQGEDAQ